MRRIPQGRRIRFSLSRKDSNGAITSTGGTINGLTGASLTTSSGVTHATGVDTVTTVKVNGGELNVNGTLNSPNTVTVAPGAELSGDGTIGGSVSGNGEFSPGSNNTIGRLNVTGNVAMGSTDTYLVTFATAADAISIGGSVTLGGIVTPVRLSGGPLVKQLRFDILHAAGGFGQTTFAGVAATPNFSTSLSYERGADVFLTVTAQLGLGSLLPANAGGVANAINAALNNGATLAPNFANLFALSGSDLANAAGQLDGEAATGAERAAFQLTTGFLGLMLDPFVNGRGALGGSGGDGGHSFGALGFVPDEQTELPPKIALAYSAILAKAPLQPQSLEPRWGAWGSAYGGSNTASGNAATGSTTVTASTYGFASGMDYRMSSSTVVGFALGGAGANWGLANGLGGGRSDSFQVGGYGVSWFDRAYVAGALSFSNHWFTTNRSALGDALNANFVGQSYGARLESGYRAAVLPAFAVTPYGAMQFQDFHTPAFGESDTTGGGFGLSYAARNATGLRTELGARFHNLAVVNNKPLVLFGRLAWAHDFVSKPTLSAAFETLPGGGRFTVKGAPFPHDWALTTAGAQLYLAANWSLIAKFEGEFAPGSKTYGGAGTLRYTW